MKKLIKVTLIYIISIQAFAGVDQVWNILVERQGDIESYPSIVEELIKDDLYFTAVPFLKEYLTNSRRKIESRKIDNLIDQVITNVGVKQFEVLPERFLIRSRAPIMRYMLARKFFRKSKYKNVIKVLNATIPRGHPVKPFALFLEGSAFSILKKYKTAIAAYRECVAVSNNRLGNENEKNIIRQLKINRDYCLVGVARSQFAAREFEKAKESYLDLPKTSFIWPEILFEEAWNSFYQNDYNRTLGKLVTYRAPFLNYYFNPETEVLKALTYLELCLYEDTQKTVEEFYQDFEQEHDEVEKFIKRHGRDYKYFYLLGKTGKAGRVRGNELLNTMIRALVRDPSFIEIFESFQNGKKEISKINDIRNSRLKRILKQNIKQSLLLQRNLIGAYVRNEIITYHSQMVEAFENMSYLNLEVLKKRKQELYTPGAETSISKRGDVKNINRTDKQYFWNFNGEFWADELGDYVFSLKSSCGNEK